MIYVRQRFIMTSLKVLDPPVHKSYTTTWISHKRASNFYFGFNQLIRAFITRRGGRRGYRKHAHCPVRVFWRIHWIGSLEESEVDNGDTPWVLGTRRKRRSTAGIGGTMKIKFWYKQHAAIKSLREILYIFLSLHFRYLSNSKYCALVTCAFRVV